MGIWQIDGSRRRFSSGMYHRFGKRSSGSSGLGSMSEPRSFCADLAAIRPGIAVFGGSGRRAGYPENLTVIRRQMISGPKVTTSDEGFVRHRRLKNLTGYKTNSVAV